MTKVIISALAASLLFVACSSEEDTKAKNEVAVKVEAKKVEVKKIEKVEEVVVKKVEAVKTEMKKEVVLEKTAVQIYAACAGCHGMDGSKMALNKSAVIKGWSKAKIADALTGYKNGTYGAAMKGIMSGQVKNLSSADIEKLAEHISGF